MMFSERNRAELTAGDPVLLVEGGRRYRCRVLAVESFITKAGKSQIVQLNPLEGPWPRGTRLVRLDDDVVPAPAPARAPSFDGIDDAGERLAG